MVITRVAPLSCARIAAALYALMGLAIGIVVSLFSLAGGFATTAFLADPTRPVGFGRLWGVGAIFVFPLLYGMLGFVGAVVAAWLYNTIAKFTGGIEVDLR